MVESVHNAVGGLASAKKLASANLTSYIPWQLATFEVGGMPTSGRDYSLGCGARGMPAPASNGRRYAGGRPGTFG